MSNQYNLSENDFKIKCEELDLIYIGSYKKEKRGTMIQFQCPRHFNKGIQEKPWSAFRKQKRGCIYCYGRGKTTEEVAKEVKNKDVELISEYVGNEKPITCKCRKCGNIWTTLPKTLVTNGAGCPKCGKAKAIKGETKSQEKFEEEMYEVNPYIEIRGKYKNTHTKILCHCHLCNTDWYGYPANLLNLSAGCPGCNASTGEQAMYTALKRIGIPFISQHTIPECKYERHLKFDAFDIKDNIAFEFNGEQHYRPVDFAGKGDEWARDHFDITKKRDDAKYQYCDDHDIKMIIAPYWERNNIENYLRQKLKELNLQIA